ncbi:MAG: hypothetical protein ACE361_07010 [Aureliella sp.]
MSRNTLGELTRRNVVLAFSVGGDQLVMSGGLSRRGALATTEP